MNSRSMFKGAVALVYLINPLESFAGGIAIVDPEIREMEGRKFVVGRIPDTLDDWASGLRISVAFDQIAHFIEFGSEKDFLERSGQALAGFGSKTVHVQ